MIHGQEATPAFLTGFLGVRTNAFATATQQAKLGVLPQYFEHNAVSYVLQAIALVVVLSQHRKLASWAEFIN